MGKQKKQLRIGLAGLGNVGAGVYKNLDKNVLKIFDVNNSMNSKKSYGGTSTANVKAMIKKYKKEVKWKYWY